MFVCLFVPLLTTWGCTCSSQISLVSRPCLAHYSEKRKTETKCLFSSKYTHTHTYFNTISLFPYSVSASLPTCYNLLVVHWLSCVWLFAVAWTVAHLASLSFTISWSLLQHTSFESVMPSKHLILCRPLLLLPSIFPSIRVFSSELALHVKWPKDWSFSFHISPSNEYSGLISFEMDWFDLAVQDNGSVIPKPKLAGSLWWSFAAMHRVAKTCSHSMCIFQLMDTALMKQPGFVVSVLIL